MFALLRYDNTKYCVVPKKYTLRKNGECIVRNKGSRYRAFFIAYNCKSILIFVFIWVFIFVFIWLFNYINPARCYYFIAHYKDLEIIARNLNNGLPNIILHQCQDIKSSSSNTSDNLIIGIYCFLKLNLSYLVECRVRIVTLLFYVFIYIDLKELKSSTPHGESYKMSISGNNTSGVKILDSMSKSATIIGTYIYIYTYLQLLHSSQTAQCPKSRHKTSCRCLMFQWLKDDVLSGPLHIDMQFNFIINCFINIYLCTI